MGVVKPQVTFYSLLSSVPDAAICGLDEPKSVDSGTDNPKSGVAYELFKGPLRLKIEYIKKIVVTIDMVNSRHTR